MVEQIQLIMKDQILKIAGVKDEKSFYKKYPSEEAFMKVHGKAFKKAQMGAAVKKAQVGTQTPNFNINQFGIGAQTMGQMNQTSGASASGGSTPIVDTSNANWMFKNTSGAPFEASNINKGFTGYQGEVGQAAGAASSIMPYAQAATSVISGIKALKQQKKDLKEAKAWNQITGLQARAAESVDVDANRPKNYVRPEDNPVQPNQLFPTYGVGTNVLKRNGGPIRAAYGAEIQNTYAPNTLYDDLGYEPLEDSDNVKQYYHGGYIPRAQEGFSAMLNSGGFGNFMGNQGGGQALGMLSGAMNNNSGGSQIGSGLGTAAGTAFGGPVGGMIGGAVGGAIGGALDKSAKKMKKEQDGIQRNQDRVMGAQFTKGIQGQYGSYMEEGGQLTNPQLITRFGELDQQDFYDYAHEGMDSLRAGGHLREYTPISERGMEQYAMGGEVKTTWGGHAETISRNPYMPGTGETIMFRGKSHDESDGNGHTGIGVTYGKGQHDSYTDYAEFGSQGADADVEVERGEPAAELQDANGEKNLTVYGNLKIPNQYLPLLNDPRAKGKKFKNYINEISKDEDRQTKLIDKSTNLLNELDVRSSFDKLKFDALSSSIKGANMKLKDIADKKKNAAYLQNAINDTAEENGLVADDLARGKIKFDKQAAQEYARHGKSIEKAQTGAYKIKGKGKKWAYTPAGETGVPEFDDPGLYVTQWSKSIDEALADKERADQMIKYLERAPGPEGQKVRDALATKQSRDEKIKFIREQATNSQVGPMHYVVRAARDVTMPKKKEPVTTKQTTVETPTEKTYETTPYKRSKIMDIANMVLPFLRPTDQEPLDPRQLSGEMYALSTNQLEPVQAQGFQPDLATPYDISYQDQMNEITAQTRAAQRMAQGNPAAQALIAGQAYDAINKVKGEEFRANQAMQAGVYNQNRATLNDAKLKNLDIYDRQYTRQEQAKSNTKAITQAALNSISDKYAKNKLENRTLGVYENMYNYRYDPSGRAINMNPLYQPNMPTIYGKQNNPNMIPVKDANGNIIEFRSITPTGTQTTKTVVEETTPEEDLSDVSALPKKNGGKTKKKIAMNGSIVKMYKTI
jgi:hypothetical protein